MLRHLVVILTFALSCTSVVSCTSAGPFSKSAKLDDAVRELVDLPNHVSAHEGKVTVFADYRDVSQDRITVYIINRTRRAIDVPTQDGDPFLKLEAANGEAWERAQAHRYSFCGLSYMPVKVPAGHFAVAEAWYPTTGTPATVRYRTYGELDLVSNEGPGFVVEDEHWRAQHDRMAVNRGDIGVVRAVLFDDVGLEGQQLVDTRRAAVKRLGQLSSKQTVPVFRKLLVPSIDVDELRNVLESYNESAPSTFAAYIAEVLKKDDPWRDKILGELRFTGDLNDDVIEILRGQALDPTSKNVGDLLASIARYKKPEVLDALRNIEASTAHALPDRIHARWQREQWYGDKGIALRLTPIGMYGDGHAVPVMLDVTIINETERAVRFSYRRPSDILVMYLTVEHHRGRRVFLPPKAGVRWLDRSSSGSETRVELAPEEEHKLKLAVGDYFELPKKADGSYMPTSVWMSVSLPGIHATPDLSGGGAGINPR